MDNGRNYGTTPARSMENGVHHEAGSFSMENAREVLGNVQTQVTTFVKERPLAAIGIALFAGFLVAKLVRS
jgi:hypothetical protein